MSDIDIEALTTALSPDEPAGPDLEYDADFIEVERLVAAAQAATNGDSPGGGAEAADWRGIDKLVHELLNRTRDLRLAVLACRSALQQAGVSGYRQRLGLVRSLLGNLWADVHPRLDPDDDNDPTMRMNILSSLADPMTALTPLRASQLVASRALGRFSWRDMLIANGELSVPQDGTEKPASMAIIEAAFMDADLDGLRQTTSAIAEAIEEVDAIERITTDYVGTEHAISLDDLRKLLAVMHRGMQTQLARRTGSELPAVADGESTGGDGDVPAASAGVPGEIRSRQDVDKAIDKIIGYYRKFEPASPVPLLMDRAKQLLGMDFMEIIRNMIPEGLPQVEMIPGPRDEETRE